MASYPKILKRYSFLLSTASQEKIQDIKKRKVSAMSTLSTSSGVSKFLEHKIKEKGLDIEFTKKYREGLVESYENKRLKKADLDDAIETNVSYENDLSEFVVLKRQRKLIEDDINDIEIKKSLEKAYSVIMLNRVKIMEGTRQDRSHKRHVQAQFRDSVEKYYNVVSEEKWRQETFKKVYCLASRCWFSPDQVKAAHIVSKSLQSEELSHLFGGDTELSDPRNALMLHAKIEEALDRANIAIVPIPSEENNFAEWKILLTDESMRDKCALIKPDGKRIGWGELDEAVLDFQNNNRPARRYLYFRFLMTFLTGKERGETEWAVKSFYKGTMWCSPGGYVRDSMLPVLARQVSDFKLSESLFLKVTFEETMASPNRSKEEEEVLAMSLNLRINDHKRKTAKKALMENEDSESENDEESETDLMIKENSESDGDKEKEREDEKHKEDSY